MKYDKTEKLWRYRCCNKELIHVCFLRETRVSCIQRMNIQRSFLFVPLKMNRDVRL